MNGYERLFGDRKGPNQTTSLAPPRVFGKRIAAFAPDPAVEHRNTGSVTDFRTVAAARLNAICSDLINLYLDSKSSSESLPFRVMMFPELKMLIGHHASVRIDETRGVYVLSIDDSRNGSAKIETGSTDLLLDYIICHLALDRGRYSSVTSHGLVSLLVGCRIEDIERSLVLATLRQYHFNRTRSAEVLGVSVRTIRNKLREYRDEPANTQATSHIFSLRRSPTPD